MAKITTVIDIGSNSIRMAVFKKTSRFGFSLIYELKSKVRISEGSYEAKGVLQEAPMQRTLSVLANFMHIAKTYKSRKILCIATSAMRDAPNRQVFVKKASQECGINVKVIDGSKEAFFGAVACANLSHNRSGIMVDIGGGSTECALIENGRIKELISLDLGTIRLKELFFDKRLDLKEARSFIQKQLDKIPTSFKHENIFGVGGTIRALAKIISKQEGSYLNVLHGFEIDVKKYIDFFTKIVCAKEEKLIDLGVSEERQDNIQGGVLILLMLLEQFKTKMITTCGVGVREGVFLADLLRTHSHRFPSDINPSLQYLKDSFLLDDYTLKIKTIANRLFDLFKDSFGIKEDFKRLLSIAAIASEMGVKVNFYNMNKHGAYMVKQVLSYGFSYYERCVIALLTEFSEKKFPKDIDIARYGIKADLGSLQILSYILSLSRVLGVIDFKGEIKVFEEQVKIYGVENNFLAREKISKIARPKNLSVLFM